MSMSFKDEEIVYNHILSEKDQFGVFHKTCLHVHTPESYDYKLLDKWEVNNYQDKDDECIYKLCIDHKVFPITTSISTFSAPEVLGDFQSVKQMLSFLLLADVIIENHISIIVVADHHTIGGVPKLKKAISYLNEFKKINVYPEVILGVEISCADKQHVIGIFDDSIKNHDAINGWLSENLMNIHDGTFETSRSVLNFIRENDGIGYLAHLDTSDTFSDSFLSLAYKKKLFSDISIVGLSNISKEDYIKYKLREYSARDIKFLIDNDSHAVDTLGKKFIWIKGQKRNFKTIKEAFADFDICVQLSENTYNRQYIKGIYIQQTERGFLTGKKNDSIYNGSFCINFSDTFNCLIGGRGTGKSTVLEIIEYALSQRCSNEKLLDFICAHGTIWLLYVYLESEYLVKIDTPDKGSHENILQCFGQNVDSRYKYYYHYHPEKIQELTLRKYANIFKISTENGELVFERIRDKGAMFRKFFDVRYSVNELVNTASGKEINIFLYNILFENEVLAKPESVVHARSLSGLGKMLSDVKTTLRVRYDKVHLVIDPFNCKQAGILHIAYSQNGIPQEPDFLNWLAFRHNKKRTYYKKYNLTYEDVEQYLLSLYSSMDIFEFIEMITLRDTEKALKHVNILDFCEEMTTKLIDNDINELTVLNRSQLLSVLFKELINTSNVDLIINYLKQYVRDVEDFSLEFNINNRENTYNQEVNYKNVTELSLGQKVVAMLSFIMGYSEFSGDYRPLIIDQPEDNLDNQYIYKNLVKQLRDAKSKRQVILATHNATLVTNTKAEQVCVMKSDNNHGWIETRGYSGKRVIKKHIVNYLEGGCESFRHKALLYSEILDSEE